MLKKILVVILAISLLGVFVACGRENANTQAAGKGSETESADSKLDEIQSKGKITLGTSADYPPYEFHKIIDGKDEIVGFDIEIAKLIAEELDVELEIIDMKFEGLLAALVTDDIDMVIAGMVADEERSKTVDFSIPYYQAEQRMLVRMEDKDNYKGPEELVGKKVGAQKSTVQEEIAAEKFSDSEYIGLSKITDLVLELQNKKMDAVLLAEPVAKAYADQNDSVFMADINLGQEDGTSVALNRGNEDLLAIIDKVMQENMDNGNIDKLITEATLLAED